MLVVVVTLAVLGSAVIPRLMDTRNDAFIDMMKADLQNLGAAMEHHIATYGSYPNPTMATASDSLLPGALGFGRLVGYSPSTDVIVKYKHKTKEGFMAEATTVKLPGVRCELYVGNVAAISYFNPTPKPEIKCPAP